jgi:hypothetical protein
MAVRHELNMRLMECEPEKQILETRVIVLAQANHIVRLLYIAFPWHILPSTPTLERPLLVWSYP